MQVGPKYLLLLTAVKLIKQNSIRQNDHGGAINSRQVAAVLLFWFIVEIFQRFFYSLSSTLCSLSASETPSHLDPQTHILPFPILVHTQL